MPILQLSRLLLIIIILPLKINCGVKKVSINKESAKLVVQQKRLLYKLRRELNLSFEQLQQFEQALKNIKNEESVDDINSLLTLMEVLKEELNSTSLETQKSTLMLVNSTISEYIPDLSPINHLARAKQLIDLLIQIWENVRNQVRLKI